MARVDTAARSNPLRRRLRRLGAGERREEARAFVEQFYRELNLPDEQRRQRVAQVDRDLRRHGYYEHTPEELAFGARVAWRNSARCIGRLAWRSLEVFDCRAVVAPGAMATRMCEHLSFAKGDGKIRPAISVFAPVRGDQLPAYCESRQLIQYAGYAHPGGKVLGDPLTVEFTRTAMALGWQPPSDRTPFDLLPIVIRDAQDRRQVFELPTEVVQQVAIAHPTNVEVAELDLRWYTVPCVSAMILTIGGIDYPCAPFNGYYMSTEIASRNLTDVRRYDRLREVAVALGLSTDEPLWQDTALTELNRAVLHSFARDGATLVDHHTASEQYQQFVQVEGAAGRMPSADWSWVVPPQASAACQVFHLPMHDRHMVPNYYHSRALDGDALGPRYDELRRSRFRQRMERLRRRFYSWRRLRD